MTPEEVNLYHLVDLLVKPATRLQCFGKGVVQISMSIINDLVNGQVGHANKPAQKASLQVVNEPAVLVIHRGDHADLFQCSSMGL